MRLMTGKKFESGFSLVELILVMSLVGIMSFFAVPMMLDMGAINLDGATRKVESDIRYAQNLSTTTGQEHGFRTVAGGSAEDPVTGYEVYNNVTGAVVTSPYDHMPMTEDLLDDYTGVEFDEVVDIRFDDLGSPEFVTGSGDVAMGTSDDESAKTVSVTATGLISINTPGE